MTYTASVWEGRWVPLAAGSMRWTGDLAAALLHRDR